MNLIATLSALCVAALAGHILWWAGVGDLPSSTIVTSVAVSGMALATYWLACRIKPGDRDDKPTSTATNDDSRARLADFAEASSDWFWETDSDLRYTWFSMEVERVTGVSREWHYGKTRLELGAPDPVTPEWEAHVATLLAHKPFRDFVYFRPGPDGGKWLRASGVPYFDAAGAFQGYRGTGSDISEAVLARKSAEKAQAMLQSAVESLNEFFVLWDPDDRLIICNQRFREINQAVIETTAPGTLFSDHIRAALEAGQYPASDGREDAWFEERMERHRNPARPFELQRQDGRWLLIDEQKLPDGSTATISLDITDRKRQERVIEESRHQAEEANRAKSQFLANMSHEIRTPLNAIIGMSEAILSGIFGTPENDRHKEYLEMIRSSGRHLTEIVEQILDLSKIEAGTIEIAKTELTIAEEIDATVRLTGTTLTDRGLNLIVDIADPTLQVWADRRMFRQCLLNLLNNAVKFTEKDGEIRISARQDKRVFILEVSDTGHGIARSDLERIFHPFVQVADQHTRAHAGTGLGLAIARSLLELHGGTLTAESTLGEGSSFRIALPNGV